MVQQSTPESQEFFGAIEAKAAAHPFASIKEVQAFADRQLEAQNNRGLDIFGGLSPTQMGALPGQLRGREKVLQFAALRDVPSAPIMHLFELLQVAIGDRGLKATEKVIFPDNFAENRP